MAFEPMRRPEVCRTLSLPILPTLLLLAACSGGAREGDWLGTVRDSAGVIIVDNPHQGLWAEGQGWTLEEELRIGSLRGDPTYQFGQVGAIAVDSHGNILVIDRQAQEIRVFSGTGEYLRTLGRPGSGPGELSLAATELLLSPGDTLLVPDPRNRRINRFGPEWEVLSSAPLEPERGRPLRYNLIGSGVMTVQIRPTGPDGAGLSDTTDAIVVLEPTGLLGDTLLRIPSGGLFQGPGIHYFTPEPWWDVTDSLTVLYGINSEYRIGYYGRDGSLQRIVEKTSEPTPITDRDIRAFFAYLDRAWLDAGVPRSRLPANHAQVHFAELLPTFAAFHMGYEGSLWVQPVQAPGILSDEEIERYNFLEEFGSTEWEVFDAQGKYLGVVSMPPRFMPRTFLGDRIYGVQRDELDVQYVVRLRVITGA
jgi:hypothetical protein